VPKHAILRFSRRGPGGQKENHRSKTTHVQKSDNIAVVFADGAIRFPGVEQQVVGGRVGGPPC